MQRIGERAVVLGASMAGLLAARAVADAYETVTLVEREPLPDGPQQRRAVPQGRHVHALLPAGQDALEDLLPGIVEGLAAAGAPTFEAMAELRFSLGGHELARAALGRRGVTAGRPLIEAEVRRRVLALPNVELLDGCEALGLTGGAQRVDGVRLLRRQDGSAEEVLAADLVVAATGRGARVPSWLQALGCPAPAVERLTVHLGYASRRLRIEPGALGSDKCILVGPRPGEPRGLVLFAQEHGEWLLTLSGYGECRPPADDAGFLAFARRVAPPDVMAAIDRAEPAGGIVTHGFPANRRRRYDRLRRFPAGLLVTGDAICSFNPIYGQGMTVAALEAVALRRCLAAGGHDLAGRFFGAIAPTVEAAWQLALGSDLAVPEVPGPRPARVRLTNAYVGRLQAVAARDERLAAAFMLVAGLVEPPQRLLRPGVVARVAAGSLRRPARGARVRRPAGGTETAEVAP